MKGIILVITLFLTNCGAQIDESEASPKTTMKLKKTQEPQSWVSEAPLSKFGDRNVSICETEEDARRACAKKYTSGPCRGYYQGEESWCRNRSKGDQ